MRRGKAVEVLGFVTAISIVMAWLWQPSALGASPRHSTGSLVGTQSL